MKFPFICDESFSFLLLSRFCLWHWTAFITMCLNVGVCLSLFGVQLAFWYLYLVSNLGNLGPLFLQITSLPCSAPPVPPQWFPQCQCICWSTWWCPTDLLGSQRFPFFFFLTVEVDNFPLSYLLVDCQFCTFQFQIWFFVFVHLFCFVLGGFVCFVLLLVPFCANFLLIPFHFISIVFLTSSTSSFSSSLDR